MLLEPIQASNNIKLNPTKKKIINACQKRLKKIIQQAY